MIREREREFWFDHSHCEDTFSLVVKEKKPKYFIFKSFYELFWFKSGKKKLTKFN